MGDDPADVAGLENVADVRRFGAEKQHRPADGHRAVNLAGMDHPHGLVGQTHDVNVGSRQTGADRGQWLERQRPNVSGSLRDPPFDIDLAGTATDEHEQQVFPLLE